MRQVGNVSAPDDETAATFAAAVADLRRGQELVLCLRVDAFDQAWDALDRDPVNRRWQEFMARLFEPVPGIGPGERFAMMKEVFYLE